MKVYLLMAFRFEPYGAIKVEGFNVYGESHETITRTSTRQYACVAEAEGNDFADAKKNLLLMVERWGDGWPPLVKTLRGTYPVV